MAAVIAALPGIASVDEQGDGDVLAGRGRADVGVEHLVKAEHGGCGVWPAAVVGQRADGVEHAAGQQEERGGGSGIHPYRRLGHARGPTQTDEDRADELLRRVHPHQMRHDRREGQPPQHTQADRCIGIGGGEQERGGPGAGDQQEDHRVVEALQPAARERTPVAAVIQRAGPEQSGHGCGVDGDRGDLPGSVGVGQQQCAGYQRSLEPHQMQPAPQRRLRVVQAAAGIKQRRPRHGADRAGELGAGHRQPPCRVLQANIEASAP